MPDIAKQAASYADILDLPEYLVGEILAGQLHSHPRPAPKHARAYSALGYRLGGPFDGAIDGPAGWWIIDEPELHLVPDVLVSELPETAWFELAPDWLCEILSPSTARTDRIIKMPLYAREQVLYLWLVDPDLKTLEVYQLKEGHWSLQASLKDDDPGRQPPFDAIEFSLDSLWG